MADNENPSLTGLGKFISFVLVVGLIALGGWVIWSRMQSQSAPQGQPAPSAQTDQATPPVNRDATATPPAAQQPRTAAPEAKSALQTEVPRLPAPAAYQVKDNVVDIELSNYPGYSGIIAANGGLAPNDNSVFAKKYGFKLKIALSEEESWPALNTGRLAASATTADVLAVYGKQFNVVVPAQIGYSRGADGIVVTSDINRINQLKGKVLATGQFTEAEFFIRYLAQEAGLQVGYVDDLNAKPDPEKVNLFFAEDAFAAGDLFLEDVQAGANRLAGCVTWAPKTSEVAEGSGGKAKVLVTNKNLLIVADILVVNRPFAQANPKIVQGLVEGLLEGNRMVRSNPDAHLDVLVKAFNSAADKDSQMDRGEMKRELEKVHLSNLPENLAFFSGDISSGGSFSGIYSSAVLAYGSLIRDPIDAERFLDLNPLKQIQSAGLFANEKVEIQPLKTAGAGEALETDPLLSKDIRFFFEPNSAKLDMNSSFNLENLKNIERMLQVSPGSKVLLRGHVDNARIPEFRKMGGEAMVRQGALEAMQLSKNRAAEVRQQLVDKQKIDGTRVDTIGRGWEEPAGTDSDKNRRVEVYWYTLE